MKNITRIANSCKAKHLLSNNACIATNSRSCCYTANNFTFVNALSPLKLHTHKPTSLIRIQARSSSSSSSSSSDKKDDDNVGWTEGLSDIDIEKQLLKIKRTMGSYYSKGDYQGALQCAIESEGKIKVLFGIESPIYASSLNNVALMLKLLGQYENSMAKYTDALIIYDRSVGKTHPSYLSTLANLGILYKAYAMTCKGMEKQQLLERAKEALGDSIKIRLETSKGKVDSREILTAQSNLAIVLHHSNQSDSAIELLQQTLKLCSAKHGDLDTLTASVTNNLGFVYKELKRYRESLDMYENAMDIRTAILGSKHPDTIVTMHNIAELYIVMDRIEEATAIQHRILTNLDVVGNIDVVANSKDPRFAENIEQSIGSRSSSDNVISSSSDSDSGNNSISEYMDSSNVTTNRAMSARDKILHGNK